MNIKTQEHIEYSTDMVGWVYWQSAEIDEAVYHTPIFVCDENPEENPQLLNECRNAAKASFEKAIINKNINAK